MTTETFEISRETHDPGGKVKIAVVDAVDAGADFSPCERYRRTLWRRWPTAEREGYVLWIGMNPSTANADFDDPTCKLESWFTREWGFGHYVKCNVMDYRATHPKMLLDTAVEPRSNANLPAILAAARDASMVVLAMGALHKKLQTYGHETISALRADGRELHCLKLTKAGWPGHTLYTPKITKPFLFKHGIA